MDAIRMEVINQAARECAEAPWGQTGAIVQRAANVLNLSVQRTTTLISKASRDLGLSESRKRRSDAGQSAISDSDLLLISGTMTHDRRAGKWMLSCQDAIDMLFEGGKLGLRLSASHVNRLLRERGMHPEQISRPTPSTRMRTEHINAMWQIDASVCVLYKTPKGELVLLEEDGVHYKNKLHNYTRVMNDLLVRYVGAEHASGAIGTRFYLGGETTENALDFLMWLMTQRQDVGGQPMPFHGVPYMLYTDQGSAFKSGPFANFCRAMEIDLQHHKPRNSRATGLVENAQNLVERGLESRLRFLDPESITVARLNALAELWMHAYNGTRKHSRHGMTRYAAWATIGSQHLRLAPSMEIMRALPASMAKTRTVTSDMRVTYALKGQGSQDYDLRYVPGLSAGDKVFVTVNPFDAPNVRVGVTDRETGEIVWHQVEPTAKGFMGYDASAPVAGKEFKSMPTTPAQQLRQAVDAQAYAKDGKAATAAEVEAAQRDKVAPYLGQFDPLADIKAKAASLPTYMQRPGTAHEAAAPSVEAARLSVAEACKRIKQALGELYDAGTYAWLTERYGAAGVPEDVVKQMISARRDQQNTTPGTTGLRAVGGTR
jgi:hypothetical protein